MRIFMVTGYNFTGTQVLSVIGITRRMFAVSLFEFLHFCFLYPSNQFCFHICGFTCCLFQLPTCHRIDFVVPLFFTPIYTICMQDRPRRPSGSCTLPQYGGWVTKPPLSVSSTDYRRAPPTHGFTFALRVFMNHSNHVCVKGFQVQLASQVCTTRVILI